MQRKKVSTEDSNIASYSIEAIMENLENTRYEISQLDVSLDYITEPMLMNQVIFQRKAAEMRYRYWFKLAREKKNSAIVTK